MDVGSLVEVWLLYWIMIRGNQEEVCTIHTSQKGKFLYLTYSAYIDKI